jgi:hypothetical protein
MYICVIYSQDNTGMSINREMNKILSIEMDVLRRSARKSRMERIKNEHIEEIMGVRGTPDIIDIM